MARLLTIVSANTPARLPSDKRALSLLRNIGRTLTRAKRNAPYRLRPDSIGAQEGQGLMGALPTRGYREVWVSGGRDKRRGAKDTLILTRWNCPSLGEIQFKATDEVDPTRFAPSRWPTVSLFDHPQGPVAHVNVHDNARIMQADHGDPHYREHLDLLRSLDGILGLLRALDVHIVVTADANWRRHHNAARRGDDTIYTVLWRHRLRVWSHGVDLMAHSRSLRSVRRWVVPKDYTGSDHGWLVRQFKAR